MERIAPRLARRDFVTGAAALDTVMVDGRILKRHGRLTTLDTARIMREAAETIARVSAEIAKS
jgi:hypothetical protein